MIITHFKNNGETKKVFILKNQLTTNLNDCMCWLQHVLNQAPFNSLFYIDIYGEKERERVVTFIWPNENLRLIWRQEASGSVDWRLFVATDWAKFGIEIFLSFLLFIKFASEANSIFLLFKLFDWFSVGDELICWSKLAVWLWLQRTETALAAFSSPVSFRVFILAFKWL